MKKTVITMRSTMELGYCLAYCLGKKTKQSKTFASYVTGKIITSSNH